jgi:hypothetical protein
MLTGLGDCEVNLRDGRVDTGTTLAFLVQIVRFGDFAAFGCARNGALKGARAVLFMLVENGVESDAVANCEK